MFLGRQIEFDPIEFIEECKLLLLSFFLNSSANHVKHWWCYNIYLFHVDLMIEVQRMVIFIFFLLSSWSAPLRQFLPWRAEWCAELQRQNKTAWVISLLSPCYHQTHHTIAPNEAEIAKFKTNPGPGLAWPDCKQQLTIYVRLKTRWWLELCEVMAH